MSNSRASKLAKYSNQLFIIGLISAKLKLLHIPILSSLSAPLSPLMYLLGYQTWQYQIQNQLSTFTSKDALTPPNYLYCYNLSSTIGSLASLFWIFSFCLLPNTFALISIWLFSISNGFWWQAEYNQRLSIEKQPESQTYYFYYVSYATLISLSTAIINSLNIFFPIFSITLSPLFNIYILVLSSISLYNLAQSIKPSELITNKVCSSYQKLLQLNIIKNNYSTTNCYQQSPSQQTNKPSDKIPKKEAAAATTTVEEPSHHIESQTNLPPF